MAEKSFRKYAIHVGLFLVTLFTTTIAGAELATNKVLTGWGYESSERLLNLTDLWQGLPYSLSFLAFLTFHEFGHYFAAVYYRVKCTLPYYIPVFVPVPGVVNIGSFGAIIRLKQRPISSQQYFDIGIAGPLAGFVVSLGLLIYGFLSLPPVEELEWLRQNHQHEVAIGSSLLFEFFKQVIPADPARIPPHTELIHYPYLFVGYITLFFTALNLLPIGQLDGGHVVYGMFGRRIGLFVARLTVLLLILVGGVGVIDLRHFGEQYLYFDIIQATVYIAFVMYTLSKIFRQPDRRVVLMMTVILVMIQIMFKYNFGQLEVNMIWLFYAFLVVRFIGVEHPPAQEEHQVNRPRKILGWIALVIFVLCFSPSPLRIAG